MDSELPRVSELADPADKLRYYRESKGFSQEQLGEMLGNSSWFINNFEKRFNPIYYEDAVKFAEIWPVFMRRNRSRSKRLTGVGIILTKTALLLTNMFLSGQKYPGSHLGGDYI